MNSTVLTPVRTLRTRRGAVSLMVAVAATSALSASLLAPAASAADPDGSGRCTTSFRNTSLNGNRSVTAGEKLCLRNVVLDGTISVAAGGALNVNGSTVTGAIDLSGARGFRFCGSETIAGALTAEGTTGTVRIGDNKQCAGNTVDGAILVTNSTRAVKVAGNLVSGAITIDDNSSRHDANPIISDNVIAGALDCNGNDPRPSDRGRANTVGGATTGQCRFDAP